jgi:hypothetical protein
MIGEIVAFMMPLVSDLDYPSDGFAGKLPPATKREQVKRR